MYTNGKLLFLIGESSLHPGAGEGTGYIDLPVQREGHTDYPKIESSSLKGAIRESFEEMSKKPQGRVSGDDVNAAFGREDGDITHGALNFSDARILLFPVRSMKGVFAWVSCPYILQRFKRDYELMPENKELPIDNLDSSLSDGQAAASDAITEGNRVILEEFAFERVPMKCKINNELAPEWLASKLFAGDYWSERLKKHFALVSDDAFRYFVAHCTEVVTRNKIGEQGVVQETGLFTEEYLPPFTVLYSLVTAEKEFKEEGKSADEIMKVFEKMEDIIQLGGNATIGKGVVRAVRCDIV